MVEFSLKDNIEQPVPPAAAFTTSIAPASPLLLGYTLSLPTDPSLKKMMKWKPC